MISSRVLGRVVLGQLVCLGGCSSTSSSNNPGTTTGGTGSTGTRSTTGGDPGPCGQEAERCCASGALCGGGLSCSDEYCLACGPAPASFMGCTNVATLGTASGATSPGAMPDDAQKAIDNDVCTSWNYGSYGDANAYWQVDLGSADTLQALTLWPKMTPADGDVAFRVQYKTTDTDSFTDYPSASGLTLTLHDYHPWQTTFDPPITARYFRITIVNTPSFAALREVGLYTGCTP
jgi:F5/8 type C domain-containing protein